MWKDHVLNVDFVCQVGATIYFHRCAESENLVVQQK